MSDLAPLEYYEVEFCFSYLVWGSDPCRRIPRLQAGDTRLLPLIIVCYTKNMWNIEGGTLYHVLCEQSLGSVSSHHTHHIWVQNTCKNRKWKVMCHPCYSRRKVRERFSNCKLCSFLLSLLTLDIRWPFPWKPHFHHHDDEDLLTKNCSAIYTSCNHQKLIRQLITYRLALFLMCHVNQLTMFFPP